MTDGPEVSRGFSTRQAVRVAWDRACAFSLVGRRFPKAAGFVAPWMWAIHLTAVAGQGDRIRHLPGASLTVDDGGPHRSHRPTMVLAILCLLAEFGLILVGGSALALVFVPTLGVTLGALVGVLIVAAPAVWEGLVGSIIRLSRNPESLTLGRRRRELAKEGAASVMSSLVRSPRSPAGTGRILLDAMKAEWLRQQSVVIFYPATEGLVTYYTREGAVLDDEATRRMKFDFRGGTSKRIAAEADGANKWSRFMPEA